MIANGRIEAHSPSFCFAGGGTGGHLYPALAVAEAIRRRRPDARFTFFGSNRSIDSRILGQVKGETVCQVLDPLSLRPWRWPRIYSRFRSAKELCREHFIVDRPAMVVGTGGLASVPAVLAAAEMGIATAILNPDAVPGRANRYLASKVDAVFAQWDVTRKFLSRLNVIVCGCPVRPEFRPPDSAGGFVAVGCEMPHFDSEARQSREINPFGLDQTRRTVLITGASQGARTINDAVVSIADRIAGLHNWQILHLTGEQDYERVRRRYAEIGASAVVIAYTDQMAAALADADVVISRAGASTLAELTAIGRPSILLPYPYHRDQHQLANARCLADAGAATIVRDSVDADKTGPALWAALEPLLSDDRRRATMARSAASIGRPDAAESIADRLLQMSGRMNATGHGEALKATCSATR